ncbi:MAG: hypothetical protein JST14_03220 [Bacteroidetes bacterium]|nr:hypothetical protein [Bacteroidota bacterium]
MRDIDESGARCTPLGKQCPFRACKIQWKTVIAMTAHRYCPEGARSVSRHVPIHAPLGKQFPFRACKIQWKAGIAMTAHRYLP